MRHPSVPESLEGWWILHRMFDFDRLSWDELPADERAGDSERSKFSPGSFER